ncbi:MAG: LytTR family transcriptional regulator DNA-binding domain-containing protein [Bacteroidales bacterium]|nr:LytTR family transcriptional regulator DNA-binding domain-containing protein [Bacteroidales bacterium]
MDIIKFELQNKHSITIEETNETSIISVSTILYIDCNKGVTTVHTIDRNINSTFFLKEFERILKNLGFIRVHHNTLINGRYITKIRHSNGRVTVFLQNIEISVSKRRIKTLKSVINEKPLID